MQAFTSVHAKQWLFCVRVGVLHAKLRQRSSCECKFLSFLQYYLIIQICIYSFSSVAVESRPGLCINYSLLARLPPGPEDIENYSLCQRSHWTPVDKETCWWGHRAHNSLSKTQSAFLYLPSFCPPFPSSSLSYFLPSWMSRGVRKPSLSGKPS